MEVVPPHLQWLILGLGALVALLLVGSGLGALRSRHLSRQRERLLGEVGVLQAALLPRVPERLGGLRASVAYRPADGPGAGGDFYDAFELGDGRTGFVIGDVSGHGRAVLSRTASLRYTLRAYLEAGLEPRAALALGGEVLGRELDTAFATVALAVHDTQAGTLTYATAGHPPPIVLGPSAHEPVVAGSAPPIGAGMPTGLRQTTVAFGPGSVACLFTDGLVEARSGDGLVGREGLARVVHELGEDSDAPAVLASVARDAERLTDDAAVLVLHADSPAEAGQGPERVEQLALESEQLATTDMQRFLWACGVPPLEAQRAIAAARSVSDRFDELILRVTLEDGQAEVAVLGADQATLSAAAPAAAPLEVSARRLPLELDA